MFSLIWTDAEAAEWFFLIAAIAFFIEAVLIIVGRAPARRTAEGATRPVVWSFTGIFLAIGLVLVALGLLAL